MITLRVYIDTSVVGGCLDDEFKEPSLQLIDDVIRGDKIVIVSDLLLFELEKAPTDVKNILNKIPEDNTEFVSLDEQAIDLAKAYIDDGAAAENSISDARHIAIATVNKADVLVSWNFKHIVNINRIHLYNAVNLKRGYPMLEIRSPKEVLG